MSGDSQQPLDQRYCWPIDCAIWDVDWTYRFHYFPEYNSYNTELANFSSDQIPEKVNLLVGQIMGAMNENADFDEQKVWALIKAFKAEVNAAPATRTNFVKTALFHIAFGIGNLQMAKYFYRLRLNRIFRDHEGYFAIHRAARQGHLECCKWLLQFDRKNINKLSERGETPLLAACKGCSGKDNHETVKFLLEEGADPNISRVGDETPLFSAISCNDGRTVTLLLASGANPKHRDSAGRTALHIAAALEDEAEFVRFLKLGVNLYRLDQRNESCLTVAVKARSVPIVDLILRTCSATGWRLDLVNTVDDSYDKSCLMHATKSSCREGSSEIIEKLMVYGANYSYEIHERYTAMNGILYSLSDCRYTHNREEKRSWKRSCLLCAQKLLRHASPDAIADDLDLILWIVAACKAVMLLPYVVDAKAPVDNLMRSPCHPWGNFRPLMTAVEWQHVAVADALITAGAKMIHPDLPDDASPFVFAVQRSSEIALLKCFLRHDVDVNFVSKSSLYKVPVVLIRLLQWRKSCRKPRCANVLRLLLQCGLDPSVNFWCSCSIGKNGWAVCERTEKHELLECIQNASLVHSGKLIKMLLEHSPSVPACLNNILAAIHYRPKVPLLRHLCRLAYRKSLPPSQLLDDQWVEEVDMPDDIKLYLTYKLDL